MMQNFGTPGTPNSYGYLPPTWGAGYQSPLAAIGAVLPSGATAANALLNGTPYGMMNNPQAALNYMAMAPTAASLYGQYAPMANTMFNQYQNMMTPALNNAFVAGLGRHGMITPGSGIFGSDMAKMQLPYLSAAAMGGINAAESAAAGNAGYQLSTMGALAQANAAAQRSAAAGVENTLLGMGSTRGSWVPLGYGSSGGGGGGGGYGGAGGSSPANIAPLTAGPVLNGGQWGFPASDNPQMPDGYNPTGINAWNQSTWSAPTSPPGSNNNSNWGNTTGSGPMDNPTDSGGSYDPTMAYGGSFGSDYSNLGGWG